ncbi:MAG TPA: hypothetical protein VFE39_04270 [Pseudonocardia sp.]|jgi:hypothetical protein|nr:hypothetical protein [Pseudonocardia sp.]
MIDEVAVERVRRFCPEGQWEVDYDVVHYADPDGGMWEYYSVNRAPTMLPYTQDSTRLCGLRAQHGGHAPGPTRGALPRQEGMPGRLGGGSRWVNRPERADAPLLDPRAAPAADRTESGA